MKAMALPDTAPLGTLAHTPRRKDPREDHYFLPLSFVQLVVGQGTLDSRLHKPGATQVGSRNFQVPVGGSIRAQNSQPFQAEASGREGE